MAKKPSVPGTFKPDEDLHIEQSLPQPMVETFIHNGMVEVQQVPTPEGMVTLLRFHTPGMVYTIKLDEGGVEHIINALGGSSAARRILIAGENEVPNLRG